MSDDPKYKYYLLDLAPILVERAREVVRERNAARGAEREFHAGRVFAFNEVLSIMMQQAEGFGIALSELQLEDLDPDRDLL